MSTMTERIQKAVFSNTRAKVFAFAIMALGTMRLAGASITISDVHSGAPTATTDLGVSSVVTLLGQVTVMGMFQAQPGGSILPAGVTSVLLTDSSGAVVSDFLTLTVTGGILGTPSAVTLLFEDQSAADFSAAVANLQARNTASVAVTGSLQDLSSMLGSGALTVQVQSGSAVPDSGSTAILLGLALVALGGFSWSGRRC